MSLITPCPFRLQSPLHDNISDDYDNEDNEIEVGPGGNMEAHPKTKRLSESKTCSRFIKWKLFS